MKKSLLLLFDIGNTHTHLALAEGLRLRKHLDVATRGWQDGSTAAQVRRWLGQADISGAVLCSVVPAATPLVCQLVRQILGKDPLILGPRTLRGVGIRYPRPETIGPDRLANAVAAHHHYGAPSVVVDFGTAVTFDVVDAHGDYVGGIIAPGLSAMTDYLHEKTALLPRIKIREVRSVIGKNTEEAMRIGAVHGYRGLIRELIQELKADLRAERLPVVATGGYAELISAGLSEITAVAPNLTLEGLRLVWTAHHAAPAGGAIPCAPPPASRRSPRRAVRPASRGCRR